MKINNEEELTQALKELRTILSAEEGTLEYDRALELEIAIEEYEDIHYPI